MMNREQTVQTFKRKLDEWNSEMDALERKAETFDDVRSGTQEAWDAMSQSIDRAVERYN